MHHPAYHAEGGDEFEKFAAVFGGQRDVAGGEGGPGREIERVSRKGRKGVALGRVHGESLSCSYHGWTFDGSGACVDIPTGEGLGDKLPGLKQRARLKTYPAEDRAGYIWAFYGDPAQATALSAVPYELEDPRWAAYLKEGCVVRLQSTPRVWPVAAS